MIWGKAIEIIVRIYELTSLLRKNETYGLKSP